MNVTQLGIEGVLLIAPKVFLDERGAFLETFNQEISRAIGSPTFVQDNESHSKRGVLRGLHYQVAKAQGKLVRVVAGEVFDVAVDLRKGSPTFGKWTSAILSGQNKHIFWIPPGLAHGFLALSESAILSYKCTDAYSPQHERTLIWDDPDVGIQWPLTGGPILSPKDQAGVRFCNAEVYA